MEHLREAIAEILRESVEFPPGIFVTVIEAKITRDSLHAKAVLSVMPAGCEKEVVETLKDYQREIKDGLAHKLRMRRVPTMFWDFDTTEAEASVIENTINELERRGDLGPPIEKPSGLTE